MLCSGMSLLLSLQSESVCLYAGKRDPTGSSRPHESLSYS